MNNVVALRFPVAVVLSQSVRRWDREDSSVQKVINAAVDHAIKHCRGHILLCMAGDELQDVLRKKIAELLTESFRARRYVLYTLTEAECAGDTIPLTFTPLQQECLRLCHLHDRTGARFDFVGDIWKIRAIESALLFATRYLNNTVPARVRSGTFRYIFPRPEGCGTGMHSF